MIKAKKLTIGIDCDDVLFQCNEPAIKRLNEETGSSYTTEDLIGWCRKPEGVGGILKYYKDPEFLKTQPLYKGAKQFVKALLDRHCDVLFITAVPPELASVRAQRICECFNDVNPSNIVLTHRKDICNVDILLDDAAHNILSSPAKYPILFRHPWNRDVTGCLAVTNYDEALNMIDTIILQGGYQMDTNQADVLCLIGPSGSGKSKIIEEILSQNKNYQVPVIFTTSTRSQIYYNHVTRKTFVEMRANDEFAEITSYAGDYFGIRKADMVFSDFNKLVIPIDVCGANALKREYGNTKVKTVYVNRQRADLITDILTKDIPEDKKVLRIMALDGERKNASLCDDIIDNNDTIESARQLLSMMKGELFDGN